MNYDELKVKLPKIYVRRLEAYAKACDVTVEGFLEDLLSNYLEEQARVYDSFDEEIYKREMEI